MRIALNGLALLAVLLAQFALAPFTLATNTDESTQRIRTETAHECVSGKIKNIATRQTILRGTHVEFYDEKMSIDGWVFKAPKDPQDEAERMVSWDLPGHILDAELATRVNKRQVIQSDDKIEKRVRLIRPSNLSRRVYSIGPDAPASDPSPSQHLRTDLEDFDIGKFLDQKIPEYIRRIKKIEVPKDSPYLHLYEIQKATHRFDGRSLTYFNDGGLSLVFAAHPPAKDFAYGDVKQAVRSGSEVIKIPKTVDENMVRDFAGTLAMFDLMQELSKRTWLENAPGHPGRIPLFEVAMPDLDLELLKRVAIVQKLYAESETLFDVTRRVLSTQANPQDAETLVKDFRLDPALLRIQNQNIEYLFALIDNTVVDATKKWAITPRTNTIRGRNLRVEIGIDLGHGKNFLVLPGGKLVFIDP